MNYHIKIEEGPFAGAYTVKPCLLVSMSSRHSAKMTREITKEALKIEKEGGTVLIADRYGPLLFE
ncbi:hypothetical protein [Vibrio mediterranei]|uniref:hypothetical protein n=1 Tax=Vibrio mediterranei TaxID=689 RepID=UPI004069047A